MCERILCLFAIALLTPVSVLAHDFDVEEEAKSLLEAGAAGFAMALVDRNGVCWSTAFGFADVDDGLPMTIDTVMNIASISKTLTGVSLMMLAEQGKLDLDRDINEYLPFRVENPNYPDEVITARQLLTHTSSIIDREGFYDSETVYHQGGDNPQRLGDFLRAYLTLDGDYYRHENYLTQPPASVRQYSNIAYGLAGYLVEIISGDALNLFTSKHIFAPLGMDSTGWMLSEIDKEMHAALYETSDDGPVEIDWYGLATWPDGGLRTSVSDLGRFIGAMINEGKFEGHRILTTRSMEEMFTPQFGLAASFKEVADEPGSRQAITWSYRERKNGGDAVLGHGGGDPGVTTLAYFYRGRGTGAILMINTSSESAEFSQAVSALFAVLMKAAKI